MITSSPGSIVAARALKMALLAPFVAMICRIGEAVLAQELGRDGLPQFERACHRGIAGRAGLHGPRRSLADMSGSIEIGLSDNEADDVPALAPQLAGTVGGGGTGRRLDASDTLCDSERAHK